MRPGTFKDHVHQAFTEAVENGREVERLLKLLQWCRPRLTKDCYREYMDKCLADPTLLDPDPNMQGKMTNGDNDVREPRTAAGSLD